MVLSPPRKQERLKILFLIPYFAPAWHFGGPVKGTYETGRRLASKGHQITVLTTNLDRPGRRLPLVEKQLDGMRVIYFSTLLYSLSLKFNFPFPPALFLWLKKHRNQFDAIHIQECYSSMTLLAPLVLGKTPYVISTRGVFGAYPQQQKSLLKRLFNWLAEKTIRRAQALVVQTSRERKDCERFSPRRIVEVNNGIEPALFKQLPSGREFRRRHGFSINDIIVLYIGRLHPIKGLECLVHAISRIENKNIKALIVGPDYGVRKRLCQIATKQETTQRIKLLDGLYDREKLAAYSAADLYCQPSLYDNAPNSVLEACACGLPVITTSGNGLSSFLVKHGGIVVPSGKPEPLQRAIVKLAGPKTLRTSLGRRIKRAACRGFSWNDVTGRLEELYYQISRDPRGRA